MTVEPLSATPLHPVRRAVFTQHWGELAFLHWPVDPALVAPLLPPGTVPDVVDGRTWVGLVPFVMSGVGILGTPPLPYLSRFAETNVRLYAVDADGRRGVVFRSLEAARLLPVLAARWTYHLPYLWARMRYESVGDVRTYTTSRRWPGPRGTGGTVSLRVGARVASDPLADFLTARWGLYSTWYGGRTAWAPVEHPPWPLHAAELLHLSDDLVPAAGLPRPEGAPHVLWSPGVDVRIGRPVLLPR
ncbi:MAG: hypothetical protein JWM64_2560 [Frankiales bacterium]|nr:hypothetical protein [Frankiales bacterium]